MKMKKPEWLTELREWLGTLALIAIAILAVLFVPEYLKRTASSRTH